MKSLGQRNRDENRRNPIHGDQTLRNRTQTKPVGARLRRTDQTDKMGRVRTSLERREQLLDEFEKSQLSGQKFAQLTGLKYSTFAVWVAARRRRQAAMSPALPAPASQTVEWLETVIDKAQASTPVAGSPLIVRLPSGAAIELTNWGCS